MTGMPLVLHPLQLGSLTDQALTGFSIATVDAMILTPLERMKILSARKGDNFRAFEWRGFTAYWTKLSVNWVAFLVAQKYLRDRNTTDKPLTLPQLMKIGVQVAVIVSIASAPFDVANTRKQINATHKISEYRGWPLSALSLVIHNIATVVVLDRFVSS